MMDSLMSPTPASGISTNVFFLTDCARKEVYLGHIPDIKSYSVQNGSCNKEQEQTISYSIFVDLLSFLLTAEW